MSLSKTPATSRCRHSRRYLHTALDAHRNPPWGSAEGTKHAGLARMFNHGAAMTNVFAWGIGEDNLFRRATEGDEAAAACRKFLRGGCLDAAPLAQSCCGRGSVLPSLMRALANSWRPTAAGDPAASIVSPAKAWP